MHQHELRREPLSSQLLPDRELLVALPVGYEAAPLRRYPVLYMQDGQNLFGDAASPMSGKGWRLDTTAAELTAAGEMEPLILVGIPNQGEQRATEYTPAYNEARGAGGKAALYGRMLVEEIKPLVDRTYRTRPGAVDTGLGGSSFGALVALHVGLRYPHTFGKLALLSLAVAWNGPVILQQIEELATRPPLRIWLDVGTEEGEAIMVGARAVRDALTARGWVLGQDLNYVEASGARHDEGAWADRARFFLPYLFPVR
jgi:predicted alpha/beta superfamily hydrolase